MDILVSFLRAVCGAFAVSLLVFLSINSLLASRRPAGESTGPGAAILHWPFYYVFTLTFDIAVGVLLWIPLPGTPWADWIAVLGALLILPGLAFALWGRLALGKNYFVSTNFGAQTFTGHRLITSGPYRIVRHPMYFGIIVAALGSLPLYQTWTTVFLILIGLIIVRRAMVEEKVLAKTFGAEWTEYCRRVTMLFPFPLPKMGRGEGRGQDDE